MTKKRMNKKGSMSLTVLLLTTIVLIGGLLFMVDAPLKLILSNEMTDTVNNASASAVTRINEDVVKEGKLHINQSDAKETAFEVFQRTYDLEVIGGKLVRKDPDSSRLASDPEVTVTVLEKPHYEDTSWTATLPDGRTVDETTVLIEATMHFKSFSFSKSISNEDDGNLTQGLVLNRWSASQVSFPEYE